LAKLKDYGTIEEVCKSIDMSTKVLKDYTDMGTPSKIREALTKAKELLVEYKKLGTPKAIDKCMERFRGIYNNIKKKEDSSKIKTLATECGVSEAAVAKVYGSMKVEEIRKFFKDVLEQDDNSNRYRKTTTTTVNEDKDEGDNTPPWRRGSSGERLMESLGANSTFSEEVK
jgi:phosphotransferase system IIB component